MALIFASCATKKSAQAPGSDGMWTNAPVAKPMAIVSGRIDSVNPKGRYVVISFQIGTMPPLDSRLTVYRAGVKVAELKVTPPQQNNFTAADIIEGECQIGDEARAN